jgi:hypothetical protein
MAQIERDPDREIDSSSLEQAGAILEAEWQWAIVDHRRLYIDAHKE